ncbi:MAG: DNA gyrase subunit A, partial [Candidatus Brocadiia bacterium]
CRNRAHILEGLILAVSDIDEIIELIKKSPDTPTAKLNLMKKPLRLAEVATLQDILPEAFIKEKSGTDQFLTGPQADALLTMQLQRLTGLEIKKLAQEYAELMEKIEGYEAILANDQVLIDIIREDVYEMKEKYKDKRRTQITSQIEEFDIEDLIAEEEMIVTISHSGYVKRMPIDTYRKQGRGGRGIIGSDTKEGDFIEHLFVASTHDYLLVFTDQGKCYWLKVYDVPSMSRQSMGRNIVNLLNLGTQKVASIINVSNLMTKGDELGEERQLVMATRNGVVKKTKLSAYSNPRTNGVNAIKLDTNDYLIGVALTAGKNDIVIGTSDGMAIRFNEKQVRSMGRVSRGVKGIKLREKDVVVDMVIAHEDSALLTVCENGYGKRTSLEDYRSQSRGGIGLINIKTTDRNGKVVALKAVQDTDELMLITAKGIIIRTGLNELREIGRNTQGVRLIKLDEGDTLVAVEKIGFEESDEEDSGDENVKPVSSAIEEVKAAAVVSEDLETDGSEVLPLEEQADDVEEEIDDEIETEDVSEDEEEFE